MSLKLEMSDQTKVVALESEAQTIDETSSFRKSSSNAVLLLLKRVECAQFVLRLLCLIVTLVALTFMLLAKENATISVYGFQLPVRSKWSFSNSFEYLVGVTATVVGHSLVQLVISLLNLLRRRSPISRSTRRHAWLIFAIDQVFAYAMMSAGSAASGVTNLNKTGVKHSTMPKFCNWLHSFCDHVAVSIGFTFLGCFLLALSAVLDVISISKACLIA